MKLIPILAAIALVAAISYGFAHGGDHGGGGGGGGQSDKSYGGPTQTWCDVDSHCNGWDKMIAELRAHPGQDPAVPYGIFRAPAVAQYVVGARSVPYGVFAQAQPRQRVAQVQRKPVHIAIHRPLDITPKLPTFASSLQ